MTRIVPRSESGLRPRIGTPTRLVSDLCTIHWEGPKMGTFPHSSCAGKVQSIQRYHMDTKGWTDIAYSAVVCPHGDVYAGRGPGVRTGANGTNTGNASAYAVCALVGEGDPITDALLDGIAAAVAWLGCTRTNAHRDWKPTACPGDVLAGLAHSGRFLRPTTPPSPPAPIPEDDMPYTEAQLKAIVADAVAPLARDIAEIKSETVESRDNKGGKKASMRWLVAKIAKGEKVT